jgi:predicted Rossmann fold nucleotide-binding protein DprA/Smf involved in DNA uptake
LCGLLGRPEERLGASAPYRLWAIGNSAILGARKVALLSSVRCPGDEILAAYDAAQKLRDDGVTVISGLHSPVEKECLRILLRGRQPIIVGLARAMDKIPLAESLASAVGSRAHAFAFAF